MAKRKKKWRVSDVVEAVCKERGVSCNIDDFHRDVNGVWIVSVCREDSKRSFRNLVVNHLPDTLPKFFGFPNIKDQENWSPLSLFFGFPYHHETYGWGPASRLKDRLEALAVRIVAEARRLNVARRG